MMERGDLTISTPETITNKVLAGRKIDKEFLFL
jgi:hypothetical protein